MKRLNKKNISNNQHKIDSTTNLRNAKAGIVHLGFGAFHRAHQALITDKFIKEKGGDWKIIGVNWGGVDVKQQLTPQDNLYTVAVGENDKLSCEIISIIDKVLNSDETNEVLSYMCDERIKIVSMTVTEKGYCHNPVTGRLNKDNPLIQHDLKNLTQPKSAIGFIVSAIKYRKEHNTKPFTPLSCDNLPENGKILKQVVLDFTEALDMELYHWVKNNIKFPCTMVDRIVPKTTEEDVKRVEKELQLKDEGCVVTEPFIQWVIEDSFINDRPQWEDTSISNISLTHDIVPYENMKLRLLNGTHSTMAYLGYLAGYETISETISDTKYKTLIRYIMDKEVTPSLTMNNLNLDNYKDQLINRYSNTALQHRTSQIAMDGSQKIPQRFLQTIEYCIKNNIEVKGLYLAIAGWMRYVSAIDENGKKIDVKDPLRSKLKAVWDENNQNIDKIIHTFLSFREIFNESLSQNQIFISEVTKALTRLMKYGARESVNQLVSELPS